MLSFIKSFGKPKSGSFAICCKQWKCWSFYKYLEFEIEPFMVKFCWFFVDVFCWFFSFSIFVICILWNGLHTSCVLAYFPFSLKVLLISKKKNHGKVCCLPYETGSSSFLVQKRPLWLSYFHQISTPIELFEFNFHVRMRSQYIMRINDNV